MSNHSAEHGHSLEHIDQLVKRYLIVGASLMVLTGLTVAVAYLDFSVTMAVVVALIIASFKASLVAAVFMHLISEKMMIYGVLIVTAAFFLVLLFVPLLTINDPIGT